MVTEMHQQNNHTISIDDSEYVDRSREEIEQTIEQVAEMIRNHIMNKDISKE